MTTLIIYSDFEKLPVFRIVEGDYSHLDGFVFNTIDENFTEKLQDEMNKLIFDPSFKQLPFYGKFPIDKQPFDKVINIGFAL